MKPITLISLLTTATMAMASPPIARQTQTQNLRLSDTTAQISADNSVGTITMHVQNPNTNSDWIPCTIKWNPNEIISSAQTIHCKNNEYNVRFPSGLGDDIEFFTLEVDWIVTGGNPQTAQWKFEAGTDWQCQKNTSPDVKENCLLEGARV
ncbi:hypothetical protein BO71DRAFT_478481 [Aspergillus ellipticus CBS 707.79]|uniref:AA1-like domain-containing protein n=1 Tax=Aspergillus ellipticus CBS 707.79 TaxID=1448320 RepID=A0A319D7E1_9EURO|nr:hypothetical protein BO71DRAFT_478481 [Aspergillus ellipticus CBS 707.79]